MEEPTTSPKDLRHGGFRRSGLVARRAEVSPRIDWVRVAWIAALLIADLAVWWFAVIRPLLRVF
jgi:hypothetical protein